MSEKIFVEKFVRPFKNHVSGLTDDYASKVWGEAIVD
jgi:mTERF domain-containing protein